MNLSFNINGWGLLAIFIICGCLYEIIQIIVNGFMVVRSIKNLENMPNKQREKILNAILNKDEKNNKDSTDDK